MVEMIEPGRSAKAPGGTSRRRFVGYLIAGTTLVVGADLGLARPAQAAILSLPQVPELYDLGDLQTDAARPTANLICITVHEDGTASFEIPRMEVGQGITTSTAMIIAEELDLPLDKVRVGLAPARPELMFNQLTGGSNTTVSTYTPIRVAAAVARKALLEAAAIELGSFVALLVSKDGVITAPTGKSVTYGQLATKAASPTTQSVSVTLKPQTTFSVVGTPRNRVGCQPVIVVLGAQADVARGLLDEQVVSVVVASDWGTGLSASLVAGLQEAEMTDASAALITLVDLPNLAAEAAARVLDELGSAPEVIGRAVYAGQPGHPVLIGRAHWPGVRVSVSADRGANDYVSSAGAALVECGDLGGGDDVDS